MEVIGLKFYDSCKTLYYDPKGITFSVGDGAIVERDGATDFAGIIVGNMEMSEEVLVLPLKCAVKKADDGDIEKFRQSKLREKEAFTKALEKIAEHKLEMKLIRVKSAHDLSKLIFYFTSDNRVDFRELVRDLASIYKTRIELRQIGVRDEARMLGGLGPCGRAACCSEFLTEFQPVSIKMAKEQNLSLSPTKISGLCGRLMCCLSYEHKFYSNVRKTLPKQGSDVGTPDGAGQVMDVNCLTEKVRVRVSLPDGSFDAREYSSDELTYKRKPQQSDNSAEENEDDDA